MTPSDYMNLALRTAPTNQDPKQDLTHAALGMAGESGEVVDMIKKHVFNHKSLDTTELVKEIGDALWYINLMLATIGVSWEEVMQKNIEKLAARYPTGYRDDWANTKPRTWPAGSIEIHGTSPSGY